METRLLAAITLLVASVGIRAAAPQPFVAHEWGTFTSVQGGDGKQIQWRPLINTDLPAFVYSHDRTGLQGVRLLEAVIKGEMAAFVRMETPVIYFYSDTERDVSVRVLFPNGRITEWYPRAELVGPYLTHVNNEPKIDDRPLIEWKSVKILPPDTQETSASQLIRDRAQPKADHYYEARNTDANFLRVPSGLAGKPAEHEKVLFYRGLGFSEAPLNVSLDDGEQTLSLSTHSAEPLTDLFVLTIRHGTMRYQKVSEVSAAGDVTLPFNDQPFTPLRETRERLMREVVTALEHRGLYAKEAHAMVATWRDQWFAEEGTRVLYLLPQAWTDQTLPLKISPRPENVVRVMVGRAELITPSTERSLRQQFTAFMSEDTAARQQAVAATRDLWLGRFLEPALQKVIGEPPSALLSRESENLEAAVLHPKRASAPLAQTGK